jgi:dienelactone hydrolase
MLPNGSIKPLSMGIWYPAKGTAMKYSYNRIWYSTTLAQNAFLDEAFAPYPLLLFSHGYIGGALQSTFFMEHWASCGYIVAAPDHNDASLCTLSGQRRKISRKLDLRKPMLENCWERLADIKACFHELLALSRNPNHFLFRGIDEDCIGMSGHSLGGWTSLALSGCIQEEAMLSLKASLFMVPFLKDFSLEDYKRIKIPVFYLVGEKDQYVLHPLIGFLLREEKSLRKKAYDASSPPKYFFLIKEANHFSFTDYTCFFYKNAEACREKNLKVRIMLQSSTLFWNAYLKNDEASFNKLKELEDPFLLSKEYQI